MAALVWGAYKLVSPYFFTDQAGGKLNEFKAMGQ